MFGFWYYLFSNYKFKRTSMKSFRKHNVDKILFVDLELTCWQPRNPDKHMEVIQIGVVKVDNINKEIVDKERYYIKNQFSDVSNFCTELTGISQEQIDTKGITMQKASKLIVQRFGSLNATWFGWGCGDYNAMIRDCLKKDAIMPFSDNYVNLAELYALMHGMKRNKGLKAAMRNYNIEFNGAQHDALVDAEATAELYLKFIRK